MPEDKSEVLAPRKDARADNEGMLVKEGVHDQ